MYLSLLKTIHALVFTLARSTDRPTPPLLDEPPLLDSSPSVPRGSTSTLSNMRRNRLAYLLGGWHDISAPQPATYPHQNVSCALTCVYCVKMSMIPRYAKPCGVSSARSWNCVDAASSLLKNSEPSRSIGLFDSIRASVRSALNPTCRRRH